MKKEKLGFFKKLFLVITDFRTYPFLVKHEKFHKSLLYLLKLTLILSLILTLNVIFKFNDTFNQIVDNYYEDVPEFELSDNNLKVYEKYAEKINNESFLIIDTDYTYEEYAKTKKYSGLVIYDVKILVNSDKIMVEVYNEPVYELNFEKSLFIVYDVQTNDISQEFSLQDLNYEINKQSLYNYLIKFANNKTDKIYLVTTVFIAIMVSYFISVLFKSIFIGFIISIMCSFTGIHLNFNNYIKIGIYAYTLPLIIEVIATCLVGPGKDYTYYATLLLTYVYMIYAIRAIRLDAFIMLFSSKENMKHTSNKFEQELKKYNEEVGNDEEFEFVDKHNKKIDRNDSKENDEENEETDNKK